jgi:nucleoside-diphosphate-sugar epimerase
MISAFMSDILRRLAAGESYSCPVSPGAVMWWMSARCCALNLIHAATMPASTQRILQLPALRASMDEVVSGLAELYGEDRHRLVQYQPDEAVEAGFGRFPPLDTTLAESLGFVHDGSVKQMIKNSLS